MDSCLVVGGNSGIGKAVADWIEDMNTYPVRRPDHTQMDVTERSRIRSYVATYGPFRYIVYSAGYNKLQWIKDLNHETNNVLDDTFGVNVSGFISVVSNHVHYYPNEKVSVVAVSSDAAEIPMRGSLAYCASKSALNMTIKVMARELAPLWRVNGVAPGMVEGTAMTEYIDRTIPEFRGWTPEYAREYERSSVPTGRRTTLREIASTVIWVLFGPEQMTGEIVTINGGRS